MYDQSKGSDKAPWQSLHPLQSEVFLHTFLQRRSGVRRSDDEACVAQVCGRIVSEAGRSTGTRGCLWSDRVDPPQRQLLQRWSSWLWGWGGVLAGRLAAASSWRVALLRAVIGWRAPGMAVRSLSRRSCDVPLGDTAPGTIRQRGERQNRDRSAAATKTPQCADHARKAPGTRCLQTPRHL